MTPAFIRSLMRMSSALILGLVLFSPAAFADAHIYIGTAPPPPRVEVRTASPHEGWVWRPGYHHWNGHHYVWIRGRWAHPPYQHAVWYEGRWSHEHRGWYWVPGHWAHR